jgi:hypothetical protein
LLDGRPTSRPKTLFLRSNYSANPLKGHPRGAHDGFLPYPRNHPQIFIFCCKVYGKAYT